MSATIGQWIAVRNIIVQTIESSGIDFQQPDYIDRQQQQDCIYG